MKNNNTLFSILLITFTMSFASSLYAQGRLCEIPDWFFKTQNYNSNVLAIGISDCYLDSAEAFEQAKLNALLNHSLIHNSNLSALTTLNTGNQQDNSNEITTYEYVVNSTIIKGYISGNADIEVIDSIYTINKEAIVLVRIPETDTLNLLEYTIKRRAGFQKENTGNPFFADEMDIEIYSKNSIVYQKSLAKSRNTIYEDSKEDALESESIFFFPETKRVYQYKNSGNKKATALPSPLNSGLFNSFIFNLVDQICIYNSFKTDFHHKLSSSDIGKLESINRNESFQQYVYSLKNIQSRNIKTKVENICLISNQLYAYFKPGNTNHDFGQQTYSFNRKDKKEEKKLLEEDWKYLGNYDVVNAWFGAKNGIKGQAPNVLVAGSELNSNNLNSGILAAIHLAKLELSSQLSAKINALTNSEVTNKGESHVQSAKLLNLTKTEEIKPFYLFYRQINPISYQIKALLFYEFSEE